MQLAMIFVALPALCGALDAGLEERAFSEGRFGRAFDLRGRSVVIETGDAMTERPITFECWWKVDDLNGFNIALSMAPKSARHWELYTQGSTGELSMYLPPYGDLRSGYCVTPKQWMFISLTFTDTELILLVDGKEVLRNDYGQRLSFDSTTLLAGAIQNEVLGCRGAIDDLHITRTPTVGVPSEPLTAGEGTLALYPFDTINPETENAANIVATAIGEAVIMDDMKMPEGDRFLDEVQDEAYVASTLHGDAWVEYESHLPAKELSARSAASAPKTSSPESILLNGSWKMAGGRPSVPSNLGVGKASPDESQGVAEGWFKPDYDRSAWHTVEVPTSVQHALLTLGEIDDPFWDDNTYQELKEHGAPKDAPAWTFKRSRVEQQDWWFARTFEVPATWKGRSIRLHFDGIDYAGSVFVNGHSLGYHEGMFGGPTHDITGLVSFDSPNEVVVRLDAVDDTWYGHLKGSPGWGWHYGNLVSTGIWRDVVLEVVPETELQAPYVRTLSLSDSQAAISITYDLRHSGPDPATLEVVGTITGKTFQSEPVTFCNDVSAPYGLTRYTTSIQLADPKPWWPMNYGNPDLYHLTLTLQDKASGAALDSIETDFGVRTVEMAPLRGTRAEEHYRWQFVINGVPMFIKGANWCWSDPMLEMDPAKYEQILELARRGGIQMFRCWGGGIIESDEFYRLCNAKGLMVYQEFPYCWGPPDFPNTDPAVLDQQVSSVVKRLRNHPALVMWGGGNENVGIAGNDEGLFLVGRRCRQFDPSRPFHRTSPWGGSFHNWGVFHNGLPIDSGFTGNPSVWFGEFGCPSMPNWSSALRFLPEEKLNTWPPNREDGGILMHLNQFSVGDLAKVMRYADYGPISSWRHYIEYGQMAQGDEIAFAANLQRSGSYLNKGGLWFYKMTELFPGQSWGVLDFYANPKLSYYRAAQTFKPQAAFLFVERFDWTAGETFTADLHVSNDSGYPLEGARVEVTLYGSNLQPLFNQTWEVNTLEKGTREFLGKVEIVLPEGNCRPFLANTRLTAGDGTSLSDQWSWFNFQNKTEAVKEMEAIPAWGWPGDKPEAYEKVFDAYASLPQEGLLFLPRTSLEAHLQQDGNKATLTIANTGTLPAFNVLVDGFPYAYGNFLEDNSFGLRPGESRNLKLELAAAGTALDSLSVRAWNADTVKP